MDFAKRLPSIASRVANPSTASSATPAAKYHSRGSAKRRGATGPVLAGPGLCKV